MGSKNAGYRLTLFAHPRILTLFTPLLQEGVWVDVTVGRSLRSILCDQLGLDSRYVDERIQTVFLNGRPVDRMETAMVPDGAVLALSASLPGLLGATLRKSGFYASLRRGITHVEGEGRSSNQGGRGRITLKVFNVLLRELAPGLLARGVVVNGDRLWIRIREVEALYLEAVRVVELNGERLDPARLPEALWEPESPILVSVKDPTEA